MTLSKKKQVQAADDDNVYHIYRKKKVPDLLILLVMMNKISESIYPSVSEALGQAIFQRINFAFCSIHISRIQPQMNIFL